MKCEKKLKNQKKSDCLETIGKKDCFDSCKCISVKTVLPDF